MDSEGTTWIGNLYQNFENRLLELQETTFEETIQHVENSMQTVAESVRKFYSDVKENLHAAPVFPIGYFPCVGSSRKSRGSKKEASNANINRDSDESTNVESTDIEPKVDSNENQQDENMSVSVTAAEIDLSETSSCDSSISYEASNENQNHEAVVMKTVSAEVATFPSDDDYCDEFEKASTEEKASVMELVESAEEKSVISSDIFEDIHENIDAAIEKDQKTTQKDDELKIEETCVMVRSDDLQPIPKGKINLKTKQKKWMQPFSWLSKKFSRNQEYKELALFHGINENGNGDCEQKDVSKVEWELVNKLHGD